MGAKHVPVGGKAVSANSLPHRQSSVVRMLQGRSRSGFALPLVLALFVIFIWITFPLWLPIVFRGTQLSATAASGTFGDAFGALNTLFSGLAFTGVVASLFLQNQQIESNRKEVERQRIQADFLSFETTFFNLLILHNTNINAAEIQPRLNEYVRGRAIFKYFYNNFEGRRYLSELQPAEAQSLSNTQHYLLLFSESADVLRQHFSTLKQLGLFVVKSSPRRGSEYGAFLRSQVSAHEAVFLLLHCLAHPEEVDLRDYVIRFSLLENILDASVIENDEIQSFPSGAYGVNQIHARASASTRAA